MPGRWGIDAADASQAWDEAGRAHREAAEAWRSNVAAWAHATQAWVALCDVMAACEGWETVAVHELASLKGSPAETVLAVIADMREAVGRALPADAPEPGAEPRPPRDDDDLEPPT